MTENMPKTEAVIRGICEGLANAPESFVTALAGVYAKLENPPPMRQWMETLPANLFFLACSLFPELLETFKEEMWQAHGEKLYHELRGSADSSQV